MLSLLIKPPTNMPDMLRVASQIRTKMINAEVSAINRTAYYARGATKREMLSVFDRPTKWTLNSLYVKRADKARLYAEVGHNDYGRGAAGKYLAPQIEGGARQHKPFERLLIAAGVMQPNEYAVPGPAYLDRHGNLPGGLMQRMLANVKALRDPYTHTNAKSKRGKREFFTMGPRTRPTGIWRRAGGEIHPLLIFTTDQPKYTPRYRFRQVRDEVVGRVYRRFMAEEMRKVIIR